MLKLLGSALIASGGVLAWYTQRAERRRRREALWDMQRALRRMGEEVRLTRTPLPALLLALAGDCGAEAAGFFTAVSRAAGAGEDLPEVWRREAGERQYLLVRHNGGHWSFPKGHVESGETEEQTALRETAEETGLLAQVDTGFRRQVTYYPKPDVVKDVIFFTARITGGREHAQEAEIAEIGWFPLQEARSLITYATDEEVLLAAETYLGGIL